MSAKSASAEERSDVVLSASHAAARGRLLAQVPARERRIEIAGLSTALLESGKGPPILLLHGPGEYGAKWLRVIPALAETHRVIAPDLPGHGATIGAGAELTRDQVLSWLQELIARTCPTPPVLVGQILGGAIAARFAAEGSGRLRGLVLSDALGLASFHPQPEFGAALMAFLAEPSGDSHDRLWRRCAFDLSSLRNAMGETWQRLRDYNLERARDSALKPVQQALMEQFGLAEIPSADLERIAVPTNLIWGRHDLATPLAVAEAASARHGWPLHIIEEAADDPALEQPEAFLNALRSCL